MVEYHGWRILPHVHLEVDCHCPTEPYPTFDDLLQERNELRQDLGRLITEVQQSSYWQQQTIFWRSRTEVEEQVVGNLSTRVEDLEIELEKTAIDLRAWRQRAMTAEAKVEEQHVALELVGNKGVAAIEAYRIVMQTIKDNP